MPESSMLNLSDLQANIVRGYSAQLARHFAISLPDAVSGTRLLQDLLPDRAQSWPTVTVADAWQRAGGQKPRYCLMVGLTSAGLAKVGVPPSTLDHFPKRFVEGPARPTDIVKRLGDDGPSDPSFWILGAPEGPEVHMMLSLFIHEDNPEFLDVNASALAEKVHRHGASILSSHDAKALPGNKVHFGFRDSIAQPRIKGVPRKSEIPDMQPECNPGEFLLGNGYQNQYDGNFLGDIPPELGTNGSYGAFRILQQDVVSFEKLIEETERRYAIDKEEVAAKLMGRWRDGTPLELSPNGDTEAGEIRLNDFDYAPSASHPSYFDDSSGLRCPIGSHIRRMNPRSGRVMGQPHSRRMIRRSMPYGPEYKGGDDECSIERGLIGYFIVGDLEMQYEFVVATWGNLDYSQAGLRGTRDPIIGAQPVEKGKFVIRTNDTRDPIVLNDLPRWVTTRGSVYCFFPGIAGLNFLASLAP